MEEMAKEYEKQGHKAYIIPEGASNAIGTLGYYNCMNEILEQEKEMGIKFDTIVVATGSGGTYAGLYVANAAKDIYSSEYSTSAITTIPRFSMFEITKIGANNRLYGTFTRTELVIIVPNAFGKICLNINLESFAPNVLAAIIYS